MDEFDKVRHLNRNLYEDEHNERLRLRGKAILSMFYLLHFIFEIDLDFENFES